MNKDAEKDKWNEGQTASDIDLDQGEDTTHRIEAAYAQPMSPQASRVSEMCLVNEGTLQEHTRLY